MANRLLPLGSYVSADTPVHRLDARVKVCLLLVASVVLFTRGTVASLAPYACLLAAVMWIARIRPGMIARGLRSTAVILALAFLANALVFGSRVDVTIAGSFGVTLDGMARGMTAVVRIILLVGFALVVSATTTPPEMCEAIVSLLAPLRVVGVPIGDVAMIASVALRFVPECAEELDRIVLAQRARGARFDEGGIGRRVSKWTAVFAPLIVSLFRRADVLADAMRDRCYRGTGRTRMTPRMGLTDLATLVIGIILIITLNWL